MADLTLAVKPKEGLSEKDFTMSLTSTLKENG